MGTRRKHKTPKSEQWARVVAFVPIFKTPILTQSNGKRQVTPDMQVMLEERNPELLEPES